MFGPWLPSFNPDPDELLDRLLPQIDDQMLLEIARADYGQEVDGRELYQWAEAQPVSDKATWVALIGRSVAED